MSASVTHAETYKFVTKWGSYGSGDGQFSAPTGIAVDSSDNVYVADEWNYNIQKFSNSGTFLTKWGSYGSDDGQFNAPRGFAVDSSDNVYVADWDTSRIQKFSSSGEFLTKWGSEGSGDGQFVHPDGVAVDSSDNVYVADTTNYRIQKFSSSGTFLTKWGSYGSADGQFSSPDSVAVDSSGNVYVADWGNNRIQKFSSSGTFLTKWGSYGSSDGQFINPDGVAVDSSGNVYVADVGNDRIQKFSSNGKFITKWGSSGNGDGQFSAPRSVAIDFSGNVYVTDEWNSRIQKFALEKTSLIIPVADFSASPTSGNAPLKVKFTDNSTGYPTSWKWNFGDGATSIDRNPEHTYSAAGNYTVNLTVSNANGSSSKTGIITVLEPPVLKINDFTAKITTGKAPLKTEFFSDVTGKNIIKWRWDFEPPGRDYYSQHAVTAKHTFTTPGIYDITLTVWDSAGNMDTMTKQDYIVVNPIKPVKKPIANFYANKTYGKAPLTVKFTDKTINKPTSWYWDFGDGSTSNLQNPTHQYKVGGTKKYYTVSLTVQNDAGSNTKKRYNYIRVTK